MKETNKLIAEFMGLSIKEGVCYYTDADDMFPMGIEVEAPYLPYDDEWKWLMPVVRECHKVIENYGYDDDTRNFIDDEIFNLDNTLSEFFNDDKEAIYNRVLEFIKFYNQNK